MNYRTEEALGFLVAVRHATRDDLVSALEVILWEYAERDEGYMPLTLCGVMRRLAHSVATYDPGDPPPAPTRRRPSLRPTERRRLLAALPPSGDPPEVEHLALMRKLGARADTLRPELAARPGLVPVMVALVTLRRAVQAAGPVANLERLAVLVHQLDLRAEQAVRAEDHEWVITVLVGHRDTK